MRQARYSLLLIGVILFFSGATVSSRAAAPDSGILTMYGFQAGQTISYIVCGNTELTGGCFAQGSIGPFGRVGALLEGSPTVEGNVVTRRLYVLDLGAGSAGTGVVLWVYTKSDTVSDSSDTVTVRLSKQLELPLVGGASVAGFMAANENALYVGTSQSTQAVSVRKGSWAITELGGTIPSSTVDLIVADSYGYVEVLQGLGSQVGGSFNIYGPNGEDFEGGGGAPVILDWRNALIPNAQQAGNLQSTATSPLRIENIKVAPKRVPAVATE
jgi:hypothetical protein